MLSFTLLLVLMFFPVLYCGVSLWEDRAGPYSSRVSLLLVFFFSSSWCQGLVVACDCGTPYFSFSVFLRNSYKYDGYIITA